MMDISCLFRFARGYQRVIACHLGKVVLGRFTWLVNGVLPRSPGHGSEDSSDLGEVLVLADDELLCTVHFNCPKLANRRTTVSAKATRP
jgi:hypothetical protein